MEAAELRGHDEGMEILRERAGKGGGEPAVNSNFITLLFRCLFSASALTGSPKYSDDFEEEDSGKEQQVCSGRFLGLCSDVQCLSIYSSMIKSVFQVSKEPEILAQGKK